MRQAEGDTESDRTDFMHVRPDDCRKRGAGHAASTGVVADGRDNLDAGLRSGPTAGRVQAQSRNFAI